MSTKLQFSAGGFKIVCFTDGFPLRAELEGDGVIMRIQGGDIKDVEHILRRMRTAMRKHYLRPGYNMEHEATDLED